MYLPERSKNTKETVYDSIEAPGLSANAKPHVNSALLFSWCDEGIDSRNYTSKSGVPNLSMESYWGERGREKGGGREDILWIFPLDYWSTVSFYKERTLCFF